MADRRQEDYHIKNMVNRIEAGWHPSIQDLSINEEPDHAVRFHFMAENPANLETLIHFLRERSDYSIENPILLETGWKVSGASSPISLAPGIMLLWIEKMMETAQRFDCVFEGWDMGNTDRNNKILA